MRKLYEHASVCIFLTSVVILCESATSDWHESAWQRTWDTWWHYKEGVIGGPSHWGQTAFMSYAEDIWQPCRLGKMQSPIDISTKSITLDPNLTPLMISGWNIQVSLTIYNSGQDVRMEFTDTSHPVLLSGGPLVYEYRLFGAILKFGSTSERGSDHRIDGMAFPAELQFYAYNSNLYQNFSLAVSRPHGIAAISLFLQIGEQSSADLTAILSTVEQVQLKGQTRRLNGLLLSALFPPVEDYIVYQGSLPFPACHETVTWIIMNQAIFVTHEQLKALRELRMSPFRESGRMADNFRPIQSLNNRSVRTNIRLEKPEAHCTDIPYITYTAAHHVTPLPGNQEIQLQT